MSASTPSSHPLQHIVDKFRFDTSNTFIENVHLENNFYHFNVKSIIYGDRSIPTCRHDLDFPKLSFSFKNPPDFTIEQKDVGRRLSSVNKTTVENIRKSCEKSMGEMLNMKKDQFKSELESIKRAMASKKKQIEDIDSKLKI